MRKRLWFDREDRTAALRRMLETPLDGDRQIVPPRVIYAECATKTEKIRMGVKRRLASKVSHLRSA